MYALTHPEVLSMEWLPPTILDRAVELESTVAALQGARGRGTPSLVLVGGPAGCGTSTVARLAVRATLPLLRTGPGAAGRLVSVRTRFHRGPVAVAAGLLRHFDDGFEPRGFHLAEVLAGFLRRVRRDGRPTVVLLDDIGLAGPDLREVVKALLSPDRFLPEGEHGLPPMRIVLAGVPEALDRLALPFTLRSVPCVRVTLEECDAPRLRRILQDRAERALGRTLLPETVTSLAGRSLSEGGGARRAMDLLRHHLGDVPSRRSSALPGRAPSPNLLVVEDHVARAIERTAGSGPVSLREVRRWEVRLAIEDGVRPLATTTLWRRIVRLEQAGYLRREIRPGGDGGTLSRLRLLTPVRDWVTVPRATGSPRAFGHPRASFGREAAEALRSAAARSPFAAEAE